MLAQPTTGSALLFTITGSYEASFILDDHPASYTDPLSTHFFLDSGDPTVFYVSDVAGTFGGFSGKAGLTFYEDILGGDGGLTVLFAKPVTGDFEDAEPVSPQLFTGPVSAPVLFAFGPTTFSDFSDPAILTTISATLVGTAPVPEPASWLMLVGGLGLAGAAPAPPGQCQGVLRAGLISRPLDELPFGFPNSRVYA